MLGPLTRAGDSPVVPQPSRGRVDVHPFGRENGVSEGSVPRKSQNQHLVECVDRLG